MPADVALQQRCAGSLQGLRTCKMSAWASSGYQLRDLETPNTLLGVATRRARGGDLIFLATGPDATSLAMAQNTVHMLARLGLQGHAMLLADSLETCERVGERILGADACFWTSRMLVKRPSDSISLQKFWDWRFRFYWAKKHYVAELLRLGFSVLQADTDTVWVHDPFPALHDIVAATNASLVVQQDKPLAIQTRTLALMPTPTLTAALIPTRTTRSSTPGSSMRDRAARRS